MSEASNEEKKEFVEIPSENNSESDVVGNEITKSKNQPPSEEMHDFELVGLSPKNENSKSEHANSQDYSDETAQNLEAALNKEVEDEKPANSTTAHCDDLHENLNVQHNQQVKCFNLQMFHLFLIINHTEGDI